MNRRIKKKREILKKFNMSKWKYRRVVKRRCQAISNETRHCVWGCIPHEDQYARFLKRRRQFGKHENEITQRRMKRFYDRYKSIGEVILEK
jgi:hypothetical protein